MHSPTETCDWTGLEDLRPLLRRCLAPRCRDESEADDIIQETLLRAARYRKSLADPTRLRPWAVRIALNVLRDHLRCERRLPRSEDPDDVLDSIEGREPAPGEARDDVHVALVGEVLEREHALHHLHAAVATLRQEDRVVLRSYYTDGGHCADTARVCEIAPTLVKVRLFRARKRLLRVIELRVTGERARAIRPWPKVAVAETARGERRSCCAALAGRVDEGAHRARGESV